MTNDLILKVFIMMILKANYLLFGTRVGQSENKILDPETKLHPTFKNHISQ